MNTTFSQAKWPVVAGALLVLPGFYFIVAAWLNYALGISLFWRVISPLFDLPSNKNFGFNINMLIVFAPVLSILLNLRKVLSLQIISTDTEFYINATLNKYSWGWLIISMAAFCLTAICIYLLGENCNC